MSDVSHGSDSPHGPDWWQASDDRWYPGELHPWRQGGPDATQASSAAPYAFYGEPARLHHGEPAKTRPEAIVRPDGGGGIRRAAPSRHRGCGGGRSPGRRPALGFTRSREFEGAGGVRSSLATGYDRVGSGAEPHGRGRRAESDGREPRTESNCRTDDCSRHEGLQPDLALVHRLRLGGLRRGTPFGLHAWRVTGRAVRRRLWMRQVLVLVQLSRVHRPCTDLVSLVVPGRGRSER